VASTLFASKESTPICSQKTSTQLITESGTTPQTTQSHTGSRAVVSTESYPVMLKFKNIWRRCYRRSRSRSRVRTHNLLDCRQATQVRTMISWQACKALILMVLLTQQQLQCIITPHPMEALHCQPWLVQAPPANPLPLIGPSTTMSPLWVT
jgi:hypothetical protein